MFHFISGGHALEDGDVILLGGQLLRHRLLPPPCTEGGATTRRRGSVVPGGDVAVLEQLADGDRVRDRFHLARGRRYLLGRDEGDIVFPHDRTVSARHAELRWRAERDGERDGGFELRDLGSRNGTGIALRTRRRLSAGERLLIGGQMMRVERA